MEVYDGDLRLVRAGSDRRLILTDGTIEGNLLIDPVYDGFTMTTETNHSLRFVTNQQERMKITNSGYVGIGTSSPSEKLDVAGTVKADGFVGDGSGLTNVSGTPDTDWTESGGDVYRETGNVGIGTMSPNVGGAGNVKSLHIASSIMPSGVEIEAGVGYDGIIVFDEGGTNKAKIGWDASSSMFKINASSPLFNVTDFAVNNQGNVGIGTTHPLRSNLHVVERNGGDGRIEISTTANTEDKSLVLVFNNGAPVGAIHAYDYVSHSGLPLLLNAEGGNVGIGTAVPIAALHVHTDAGPHGLSAIIERPDITKNNFLQFKTLGSASDWIIGTDNNTNDLSFWSGAYYHRVSFTSDGRVGIGTGNPTEKLQVDGAAIATEWKTFSDSRFKKNVSHIDGALEKVGALRGVEFEWRTEDFPEKDFDEGRKIGLIAEEVEEVLPEVVSTGAEGYKSVGYANIVGVLVEAVKELNKENDALRSRIEVLETEQGS